MTLHFVVHDLIDGVLMGAWRYDAKMASCPLQDDVWV